MQPGYSARCRACNSPHRGEIDRRLLSGEGARKVAAWLHEDHGETFPFQGLANHRTAHLDVVSEAREQSIAAAIPAFEATVAKIKADADALDHVATMAMGLAKRWKIRLAKDVEPAPAAVQLFTGCLREVREAVMAKHEILNGKKVDVHGHISGLAELLGTAFGQEASGEVDE